MYASLYKYVLYILSAKGNYISLVTQGKLIFFMSEPLSCGDLVGDKLANRHHRNTSESDSLAGRGAECVVMLLLCSVS
jgi:hypothetical protein